MFPSQNLVIHHARHAAAFNHPTRPTAFVEAPPPPPESSALATDAMQTTATTVPATAATSDPTNAGASAAGDDYPAIILYPTGQPTMNNIDTVQVTYDTIWENANLTLFCGVDEAENKWALANIPLPEPSGTCVISPIQAGMEISQFPVSCGMLIYDESDKSESTTGGGFVMTKTNGVASTFGLSLTTTGAGNPQTTNTKKGAAATGSATNASDNISNKSGGGGGSQTVTTSLSSSTSTNTGVLSGAGSDPNTSSSSTGLSSGTKAGIAIGIILGAIALFVAVFFFFRLRKRIDRVERNITGKEGESTTGKEVPPVSASSSSPPPPVPPTSEKPILPSPRFTARSNSPAIFTPGGGGTNHNTKNSEDWRQFFGNAATVSGSNPRSHTSASA
ncbi:uncharacterized protein PV06_02631 [Exophiala oligosperma]|uniref:Mid2 domain-containing protein n=1 Tax=Exophiala oligosperma TaxID=215243 RepID=A0A0D2CB13_9EURO|nr:uncharacterized protein PV06_02631 [Exophiala oligosperma]KIW47017.1 hypothetical protein PV06_02631 [Exophiala oligosperma]